MERKFMLKVKVKNRCPVDVEKIFCKKLQSNLDYDYDSLEALVINTVKNTLHHIRCKEILCKYHRVDTLDTCLPCVFCFKQYQKGEYKRILPCGHYFHKKCIDKWIYNMNINFCPQCKEPIYRD